MAGGINIGTLAAGLGTGLAKMASIYPNMQAQMQNAAMKGAQQRDLDWSHNNRVAQQEAMGRYLQSQNFNNDLREVMMRGDMSDGQKIAALLGAVRQGSMTSPYLDTANARQELATPAGVVQAMANLPKGITAPQPPEAPAGTPPAGMIPQQTARVDRQALENRIAQNSETIRKLASLNAMIEGKNQFGQANQYGYQPNNLIGGGEVVDPEMRSAKMTSEQALATQRNASASASQARAAKTRATPVRGVGRPRKGGGRRGGGGGHYVEEERYGVKGQKNTRTGKWTPYPRIVNGGNSGRRFSFSD